MGMQHLSSGHDDMSEHLKIKGQSQKPCFEISQTSPFSSGLPKQLAQTP